MKINIAYKDSTSETADKLNDKFRAIGLQCEKNKDLKRGYININWGLSNSNTEAPFILNDLKAVSLCRDKYMSLQTLQEIGYPVVKSFTANEILDEYTMNKGIYIARFNNHQGGEDLKLCYNKAQLDWCLINGYEIFTEYVRPKKEFRVFVVDNDILFICKKPIIDVFSVAKNHTEGYPFKDLALSDLAEDTLIQIEKLKGCVNDLGLQWGAIDIIKDENNKLWVLEINSCPSLSSKHAELFANKIKENCLQ